MKLIPPSHGRAGVRALQPRRYIERVGEERVKETMRRDLDRVFQEEFGVDAPEDWLTWEILDTPAPDEVDIRLSAVGPTRSNVFYDVRRNQARTVAVPVTTESSIPIVPSPYHFDNPYVDPRHHLTFKGWDAETGLMAFDR